MALNLAANASQETAHPIQFRTASRSQEDAQEAVRPAPTVSIDIHDYQVEGPEGICGVIRRRDQQPDALLS